MQYLAAGLLRAQVDFEIVFSTHVVDSLGKKDGSSEFKEDSDIKLCSEDKPTLG